MREVLNKDEKRFIREIDLYSTNYDLTAIMKTSTTIVLIFGNKIALFAYQINYPRELICLKFYRLKLYKYYYIKDLNL